MPGAAGGPTATPPCMGSPTVQQETKENYGEHQERVQKTLARDSREWWNVNRKLRNVYKKLWARTSAIMPRGEFFLVIPYCNPCPELVSNRGVGLGWTEAWQLGVRKSGPSFVRVKVWYP